MLFIPTIAGPMSGSLGGIVASHNKGGQYFRIRSIPTDPSTPSQVTVRGIISTLSNRWSNTLTQLQRDAWGVYAANVPRPNRFGGSQLLSGIAHYVRSNTPRLQADPGGADLPVADDAPTIFNVGSYSQPTLGITPGSPGTASAIIFNVADAWVNDDDAAMLVYYGRPQNQGINFFKGPFRFGDSVLGDSVTAPTSPQIGATPFPLAVGVKAWARVNVTQADGRLGDPVIFPIIVA